jgi:hypothetical protein
VVYPQYFAEEVLQNCHLEDGDGDGRRVFWWILEKYIGRMGRE